MPKKYHKKSKEAKKIAKDKIESFFEKAEKAFDEDKALSNDFIRKARRIAMKNNIRLSPVLRRKFCKHCYSFLMPGKNLRVRTQKGKVVYSCLECKKFMRFPYGKKK